MQRMSAKRATAQPLTQIVTVKDKFTVSKELLYLFLLCKNKHVLTSSSSSQFIDSFRN